MRPTIALLGLTVMVILNLVNPKGTNAGGCRTRVREVQASWYGPGFHGKKTKSGERFNMHAMTVASNRIPLGSHVWIYNPETERAVVAKVNDTGNFEKYHRQLDVSRAVAIRLGFEDKGVTVLEVCVL